MKPEQIKVKITQEAIGKKERYLLRITIVAARTRKSKQDKIYNNHNTLGVKRKTRIGADLPVMSR